MSSDDTEKALQGLKNRMTPKAFSEVDSANPTGVDCLIYASIYSRESTLISDNGGNSASSSRHRDPYVEAVTHWLLLGLMQGRETPTNYSMASWILVLDVLFKSCSRDYHVRCREISIRVKMECRAMLLQLVVHKGPFLNGTCARG